MPGINFAHQHQARTQKGKESVTLVEPVSPGEKLSREWTVPKPAHLDDAYINTFSGQRLELRYQVRIRSEGVSYDLTHSLGSDYIGGNGSMLRLPLHWHAQEEDKLIITAENVNDTETYHAMAFVPVVYDEWVLD